MATNEVFSFPERWNFALVATDPATPTSGSPMRAGTMTGVANADEDATSLKTSGDWGFAVYDLSVKGVNDAGNSAVALYDNIYYVDADTPKLSKKSSGYFFGVALETVTSGSTDTINVLHIPSPSGILGAGTVGTSQLAADGVTAAKVTATMRTGFIPLPLAEAREITSNDYVNTAGDAGVLSKNTTPILERINGATDKKTRIAWAASNSDEIAWDFSYPPDLDDTAAIVVNLLMLMAGATDTPTVAVSYFEGIGDTNAGGNTTALSASATKKTVSIAAGDVGTYPNAASIGVVPGAHTTDACYLLGAWIEYTRK